MSPHIRVSLVRSLSVQVRSTYCHFWLLWWWWWWWWWWWLVVVGRCGFQAKEHTEYELYGVLVHAGYSVQAGHYYCYVKASDGLWYLINDDEVTSIHQPLHCP